MIRPRLFALFDRNLVIALGMLFVFSAMLPAQETIFDDRFDGNLKPGWNWIRGNIANCKFSAEGLNIRTEPFMDREAPNVLCRRAEFIKRGTVRLECLVRHCQPTDAQYQQGGIAWLQNGQIVFKLVHEQVDDRMFIFPGKIPCEAESVLLRLTINGDRLVAEYSTTDAGGFRRIYEGNINISENDDVALFCCNGPENKEHWTNFRFFRILKVDD